MIDHVVVDVEIAKTIEETPGGWDSTDKLGISVACLWEYQTQRMRIYGPEDLNTLRNRLLAADRISGFNIWKFDFPAIWGLSREDWKKSPEIANTLRDKTDDLLRRIWITLQLNPDEFTNDHKGWNLDIIAISTLGKGKIGYGGDAPKWYQTGLVQKVANYCADDVALERDLTDFVDRYGYLLRGTTRLSLPGWDSKDVINPAVRSMN